MNVDELRIRLRELVDEYSRSRRLRKQLQKDILALDDIMKRNFDADWNVDEQNYTQE